VKRSHPARAFQRSWQRQAEKLPALGRAGRRALELAQERPRLAEGPLFGTALEELTGAEAAQRKAPRRPAQRTGRTAEAPSPPPPGTGEAHRDRKLSRREAPKEPAPPRALPTEAPGADIARWAGERAAPTAGELARRRRERPADPRTVPDAESIDLHQREIAARSRHPLSVAGSSRELPRDLTAAHERPAPAAHHVAQPRDNRSGNTAPLPDPRPGNPEAQLSESISRAPLSSPPDPGETKNDPWRTLLTGTQAPRSLLVAAGQENSPPSQRRQGHAPGRPEAGRSAPPLAPGGESSPAGSSAPELPRSSRDRSDAPAFDDREGNPPPFAQIAGDPRAPHPAASPLGPFPGAPASSRALHEPAQAAASLPEAFSAFFSPPPGSADELAELAAKIERILADEARRHGIDV